MGTMLISAAVVYVIGIYIAGQFDAPSVLLFLFCFGMIALVRHCRHGRVSGRMVLLVTALSCGILACQWNESLHRQQLSELEERYVTLEGIVSELPEQETDGSFRYILTTARVEHAGKEYSAGDQIYLRAEERLNFGEYIQVRGFLRTFNLPANTGEFNTARHYKSQGVSFRIYARELERMGKQVTLWNLHYLVNSLRSRITSRIDMYFSGDSAAVLKAVLTGNKSAFSPELEETLYRSGTMRYLYSPHIHILLLVAFVNLVFGRRSKRVRDWAVIVLLVLYAGVQSSTPIFAKSCLLTAGGIWVLRRYGYSHQPDILAFVVLVVTGLHPLYAFNSGFILSVAFSLFLYYCQEFLPGGGIRRQLLVWILSLVGMMPLCAYFFEGVATYSMLASIFYVPAVVLLLAVSALFFLLTAMTGQAFFVQYVLHWILELFQKLPVWICRLPLSYLRIPQPGILFLLVFYLGLIVIRWIRWHELHKIKTHALISVCAGFIAVLFVCNIPLLGKLNLTFVNVGQGDGAILHVPFRETVIIDGGGGAEYSDYNIGEEVFVPYLSRKGYYTIDLAVVSHYHKDHCEGIIAAMEEMQIQNLLMPDVDPENTYRKQIEQLAAEHGTKILYLEPGKVIKFNSGLELKVLSPDARLRQKWDDLNDTSLVLEIRFGAFRALFGGDMTEEVETEILNAVPDCDLIKCPITARKPPVRRRF